MALPTLVELAEAGAHFGHRKALLNPQAREFIFEVRNGVSLINLEKTLSQLEKAREVLQQAKKDGLPVLVVGTKGSVRRRVAELSQEAGLPYLNERWLGGFLTNFASFADYLKRMNEMEEKLTSINSRSQKKERLVLERKLAKFARYFGGVKGITGQPQLLVVASASNDKIAVEEANRLGVPIIAITDTDIDPHNITYPIPANDDAPRAVELILVALLEEGKKPLPKKETVKDEATTEDKADEKPEAKDSKKPKAKTASKVKTAKATLSPAKPTTKKTTPTKTVKKLVTKTAKVSKGAAKKTSKKEAKKYG